MSSSNEELAARVAVYVDFDNIVISRYDQRWGRGRFHGDRLRFADPADDELRAKVDAATVDLGAVLDYAASYGTIVLSQAYADWSVPVNAGYRRQLLGRAVELVQLFPSTRGMKNGADIRLAVDVVEDLFRLPELTHIVIVAGDSDYIALAQRAKRLGKFVVGIGVAGSTSRSLAAACDEFADYDALPGVTSGGEPEPVVEGSQGRTGRGRGRRKQGRGSDAHAAPDDAVTDGGADLEALADDDADTDAPVADGGATALLVRAMRIGHAKDDEDWLHANVVKSQMKRMDPSFNEKTLGFGSFTDFVRSEAALVDVAEDGQARLLRLREPSTE